LCTLKPKKTKKPKNLKNVSKKFRFFSSPALCTGGVEMSHSLTIGQ